MGGGITFIGHIALLNFFIKHIAFSTFFLFTAFSNIFFEQFKHPSFGPILEDHYM